MTWDRQSLGQADDGDYVIARLSRLTETFIDNYLRGQRGGVSEEMVIDAGEAPFEHGPKALNAVGVDFSIGGYVLLHAVVDRLTVRQRTVGGVFVRVNAGAGLKPLMHNVVGLAAGAGNSLWPPLLDELGFRYVIILGTASGTQPTRTYCPFL